MKALPRFHGVFLISTPRVTVFRARDDAETTAIPSRGYPMNIDHFSISSTLRKTRRNLVPPRARVIYVMIPRDKHA